MMICDVCSTETKKSHCRKCGADQTWGFRPTPTFVVLFTLVAGFAFLIADFNIV